MSISLNTIHPKRENMKNIIIISLVAIVGLLGIGVGIATAADTPVYPTYGVFSPTKSYTASPAWTFTKRPKGYLVTVSAAMRFEPSVSDYITCELAGMEGVAGAEKSRFSVTFNETKTVTFVGFVVGTSLTLNCATEGQKLKPVSLNASMIGVSVDKATKR